MIPLCLHSHNIVLILSVKQRQQLIEIELPKLRSRQLFFDYVEGIELTPSDNQIWVLSYKDLICANQKGLLKKISDLYFLEKNKLIVLDRFGDKSVENILLSIEKSKKTPFEKLSTIIIFIGYSKLGGHN